MPEARYGSLPFQESIDFFRSKVNIPTERWNDVWRDGHNNGFMIAGAMKDDLLNNMRMMVDIAISEGKSLGWLKKNFKLIRAKYGWEHTGSSAWRSRVIYDTNMRQAYNAGRYEQLQYFDYWEYQHGDSISPRPLHLSWHKLLLPKDDDFWHTHFPQNGWGCKCKVFGRSQATVDRKNLNVGKAPDNGSKTWVDKVTGEEHIIPKGIDPGFDYAPRKQAMSDNLKQLAKKKATPFVSPPRIAPTAFSTVPGVDVHGLNKVLNGLKETSAAPQLEQLEKFLTQHQTKTVFIQQKQMNPRAVAATKVKQEIEDYVGKNNRLHSMQLYTVTGHESTNGFTSKLFNHVTIKAKTSSPLSKVNINEVQRSIALALEFAKAGQKQHTFTSILKKYTDNGGSNGLFTTWLHEVGHQIHYKAGSPNKPFFGKSAKLGTTITTYALKNNYEWHAELFVAWLLDRKSLAQWNPTIAKYMDDLINKALGNE